MLWRRERVSYQKVEMVRPKMGSLSCQPVWSLRCRHHELARLGQVYAPTALSLLRPQYPAMPPFRRRLACSDVQRLLTLRGPVGMVFVAVTA